MRVAVVTEHRFLRTCDGRVFTSGPLRHSFWKRYLAVFDSVRVIARIREGRLEDAAWIEDPGARADGPGVSFAAVPYYVGPGQFVLRARRIRQCLLASLAGDAAVILRVPSVLASLAEPCLRRRGRPFAVEVVGDPWDALAPGAHPHPLRMIFRRRLAQDLRRQCTESCASLYVTREALQRRYPPRPGSFTIGCSDVELPAAAFVERPREAPGEPRRATLITVGSLQHLYKGPDVLLEAVARCVERGLELRLVVVGDGCQRSALERQSQRRGISSRVLFSGQLVCGEAVRRSLDAADLFVLPSRQEGLPRALLEAMARALPAIGSTVGGIPELLPAEDLAPPGDPGSLARKIAEVLADPARLEHMSVRNLAKAREYEEACLERRRRVFLERVYAETENWVVGAAGEATDLATCGARRRRSASASASTLLGWPGENVDLEINAAGEDARATCGPDPARRP